ncbi:biotin--[acetyl-CoA-carboxylase] ligase [Planctopirus hydrillae]|uniref:Biotin--[acetyl-CoA-carboxylase] ligase n=1 Tax=Planctopirus hydrillae TaxID=1841610 RepID=A0A1C3ETQ1_9PLAN|nr:biotin--[acetyl-CoA-carboxylase] ligase [Planctopirus hydrillae]
MLDFRTEAPEWREKLLSETPLKEVEIWESLPSTNTRSLEIARDPDLKTPALVWALEQTAGRGRAGKTWLSSTGSLTLSLIVEIDTRLLARRDWFYLALKSGMAVCDTIRSFCPTGAIGVKWPNDVFVGDQKIAGVLVETPSQTQILENQHAQRVVIGIGVNVNNDISDVARKSLDREAVSLQQLFPFEAVALITFTTELSRRVLQELTTFSEEKTISDRWGEYCLLTGQLVEWQTFEQENAPLVHTGICLGIASGGELRIQKPDGSEVLANRGSIRWLPRVNTLRKKHF